MMEKDHVGGRVIAEDPRDEVEEDIHSVVNCNGGDII